MDQVALAHCVEVDHTARAAEARRIAANLGELEGLTPDQLSNLAIVVSELCTNLAKHARQGELHLSRLSLRGGKGVEILAIDHGPGIRNVNESLSDYASTAGTMGTGLGAVRRLSDAFDIYSEPDKGTVMMSQLVSQSADSNPPQHTLGIVVRPVHGEPACGDAWAARFQDDMMLLMIADGLGHGVLAADASATAVRAFQQTTDSAPVDVLQTIHRALRSTRGAAVSIARVEWQPKPEIRFAGLGNIAGVILIGEKPQSMVSHNGIAGHAARQFREFAYPWSPEGLIVMHSDGLSTNWDLSKIPAYRLHPSVVAGILYRDAARVRDDACVIVGKRR